MSTRFPWQSIKTYNDILFHKFEGIARISINRPQVHNAFTPVTVSEMIDAMNYCREDADIRRPIREHAGTFCLGTARPDPGR